MPAWCGSVIIPPTIWFLFIEILVLELIVLRVHATKVLQITLFYSIFGVLFEIFLGGLLGAPPIIIAILGPYVMVGYAFVSLIPLQILVDGKAKASTGQAVVLPSSSSIGSN